MNDIHTKAKIAAGRAQELLRESKIEPDARRRIQRLEAALLHATAAYEGFKKTNDDHEQGRMFKLMKEISNETIVFALESLRESIRRGMNDPPYQRRRESKTTARRRRRG